MIPNNPMFSSEVDFEDVIEILPLPPKSVSGLEAMAIGGEILDGGLSTRKNFTYWSVTPVGIGAGLDTRFELRAYRNNNWVVEHSIDAEFEDSSKFESLSLAFDNNNHMFIAYKDHTGINIFWYDGRVGVYNTNPYGEGTTPFMFHDGGLYGFHNTSDVIFMYSKNQVLHMSNSSNYFTEEHETLPIDGNIGIKEINITITGKLQIVFYKIPFDSFSHMVELCKNDTVWTPLAKNGNNIKRV